MDLARNWLAIPNPVVAPPRRAETGRLFSKSDLEIGHTAWVSAAPLSRNALETPEEIKGEALRNVPLQKGTHSPSFK